MSGKVHRLEGAQRDAVDPRESVWLSASAGTGKTQVLSARVLRLLLEPGADPAQILCLTFTKAGAAEMAVRVNSVLARWVRMDSAGLAAELDHLGAPIDPDTQARARSLFARVLDCPGGGLRIDTIHAFAQYLLSAFPAEAEVLPGSRAMEDRDRDLLSRDVLSELLAGGDARVREAIAEMSRRKGPDAVMGWLMRCAGHMDMWERPSWQQALRIPVRRLLGVPADAGPEWVADACADEVFDIDAMRRCLATLRDWNTKGGQEGSAAIEEWLAHSPQGRAEAIGSLNGTLFVADGSKPKNLGHLEKRDPDFAAHAERVRECTAAISKRRALLDLADFLAPQLEAGRAFAWRWKQAKAREGLVDFDDLIVRAARLLSDSEIAEWIRFKLDRSFDHILVDEAQDTNRAQWQIIRALTDDFFAGYGAQGEAIRTIFTVGDYKQAIYGFQGTSPTNFREARDWFEERMKATAVAAEESSRESFVRRLREYDLGRSYRSNATILGFVDRAIAAIGSRGLGLRKEAPPHVGSDDPGLVALWNTVHADSGMEEGEGDASWLGKHDRKLADNIARQVARWLDPAGPGFTLVKAGKPRRALAGDIMVLVQKRRDLASLIVARLHRHGVPVAGVDRLRLGNPLAVKDLMAAIRFAAQPLDDLTLANLLVSPLIGWSQEELLEHGLRNKGARLWEHLREGTHPRVAETVATLREILRRADFDSPQQLLHWILVGPIDGRRALVARLGREANDPIDELLNAASAYAASDVASLQGFIRWFDAGDGELKREAGEGGDQVRVMTVHGSKGLQAPIVILADAAIRPDPSGDLELTDDPLGEGEGPAVPLPALSKDEKVGPVAALDEAARAVAMEEHWRLLYVAMTRAEEALFIGGSLGPRDARSGPHEDSWYARLRTLFDEGEGIEDDIWGSRWELGETAEPVPASRGETAKAEAVALPDWAVRPVGPEPRPPRPLAPSGLGEEQGSAPPLAPELAASAARRGVLIHALLERLPDIVEDERRDRGRKWLARQAADLPGEDREEILERALSVLVHPDFAPVFAPGALAEVPLAAIVEGAVVTGIADRLLIGPDCVTVVDFKTARRPPETLEEVPETTLRQMAAYAAALEAIYPGREIRAAILYTQTPKLIPLSPEILAQWRGGLSPRLESFVPPPVE
ncbi:double-strand break repair helicase AddA [Qipengyuania sp. MTN3-11]|uniref:double-strand break repair helicase AddA n=1 Tax=Qipengyuania sp. MTN3-11 TaxID=3056557 RepID=UPI0036F1F830